jgi:hypothetical protein
MPRAPPTKRLKVLSPIPIVSVLSLQRRGVPGHEGNSVMSRQPTSYPSTGFLPVRSRESCYVAGGCRQVKLNDPTRLRAAFPSREHKRPVVCPRAGAWGSDWWRGIAHGGLDCGDRPCEIDAYEGSLALSPPQSVWAGGVMKSRMGRRVADSEAAGMFAAQMPGGRRRRYGATSSLFDDEGGSERRLARCTMEHTS